MKITALTFLLPLTTITFTINQTKATTADAGAIVLSIYSSDQLNDVFSNSYNKEYVLKFENDCKISPEYININNNEPLIFGGDFTFTSSDKKHISLCFDEINEEIFIGQTNIAFINLSKLSFSNTRILGYEGVKSYAITLTKNYSTLQISYINDHNDATNDIIIKNDNNGGGISTSSSVKKVEISNNGNILFENNYTDGGGSVFQTSCPVNISYNESINFINNSTKREGGAIHSHLNSFTYSNNGFLNFQNNYTNYYGGAIFSTGTHNISNNKKVSFNNNHVYGNSAFYALGGAIYSEGSLEIANNSIVEFKNNYADTHAPDMAASTSQGGAIYIEGDLRIVGNENVIFENNYEIKTTNNYFRLRSIYQKKGYFTLAAKTGGNIIFYDSVHGSSAYGISFNDKYQDSEGNTQKATGNIIFSGKYTEEHLNKIIANEYKDTNRTATETQIRNSQTSTFGGKINLYGGSLQIIEGAILQSNGITVVDNSNATLKISEGELDTENNDIIVGKSNRLELEKDALISANKITIADSAILSVTSANTDVVELSLYTLSSLESYVPSVYGTTIGGTISGNLTLEAGSSYIADRANISLNGNSLYLNATNGNKIALTLHAINSPSNKVILFSNVGKVNFDSDILANNYFTGNWINDETTLVYDSEKQVVYLENVNDVIPEPTTTTLSLLALAALATRRRRK